MVSGAPVLGEKEHSAAYKTPVAGKHEGGILGAKSHGTYGILAQRRYHHGIHHGAGGREQVLKRYRYCNYAYLLDEFGEANFCFDVELEAA